jgi:chromosome segregation ATPase
MRAALLLAATADAVSNQNFKTVIDLLNGLKADLVNEANEEQTNWAKLKVWCESAIGESANEMEEQTLKVEEFTGKVAGQNANIVKYTKERDDAATGESTMKLDIAASLAEREEANGKYEANNEELTGILGQVDEVIGKLKGLSDTAAVEPSLLQQTERLLERYSGASSSAATAIELLQQPVQGTDYAYTVKSGGVLEILEELKNQFTQEQQDATEKESRQANAYEIKKQELESKLAVYVDSKENAISAITDAEEKRGYAQAKLDTAKLSLKQATKFNGDTKKDCTGYALTYDEAQKTRAAEKAAIEQALEILSEGAVETGSAHLAEAVEADLSLMQLSASKVALSVAEPQREAARFLKQQARSLDSKVLMQIAQLASVDPFGKVKDLIRTLIEKLQEEVSNSSDKQMWCEQEMAKNQRQLDAAEEKKLGAQATLDANTANLAEAKESLAELKQQLADLRKSVSDGEQQRVTESKDNAKIISESNSAVEAVERAIEVLESVFSGQDAEALMQTESRQPEFGGEMPSAVPTGSSAAAGGSNVIASLEELGAKMRTHAQAVATEEAEAATNWRKVKKEMETEITIKETNERNTKSDVASLTTSLAEAKDDLKLAEENLKSATKYRQESLEPQCVQTAVSFEERNKKRQAEIESLQQALEILSQPAV